MKSRIRMHTFFRNGMLVVCKGAAAWDTIFSHEDPQIQTVNISQILEYIRKGKLKPGKLTGHFKEDNLREMFRLRDVDPKVVEHIRSNPRVYEQPVLFTGQPPNLTLIDGTHRVYTRWQDGLLFAPALWISPHNLQRFRVRFYINGEEYKDSRINIVKDFEFNTEAKADGH